MPPGVVGGLVVCVGLFAVCAADVALPARIVFGNGIFTPGAPERGVVAAPGVCDVVPGGTTVVEPVPADDAGLDCEGVCGVVPLVTGFAGRGGSGVIARLIASARLAVTDGGGVV